MRLGNAGDSKSLGDGVHEIRIDYGPGYRVYYGNDGKSLIILLCGGDKRKQNVDIKTAKKYWLDYKKDLLKRLKNPEYAAEYINAAIEEDDKAVILLALKDVCEARGMSNIAKKAKLNRENMYRALSEKGNPQFTTLMALLDCSGLKFTVASK